MNQYLQQFGVLILILVTGFTLYACSERVSQNSSSHAPPITPLDSRDTEFRLRSQPCNYSSFSSNRVECFQAVLQSRTESFRFPVTRIRSAHVDDLESREAVILVPGGPGQGGMTSEDWVLDWHQWMVNNDSGNDLILYDPRGVLGGDTFWLCDAYEARVKELLKQHVTMAQEVDILQPILHACLLEYDQSLRNTAFPEAGLLSFSTKHNAADLQRLMRAFDYDGYHLWGTSYGTRVALTAAFDPLVKTLLLDSPYPFHRGGIADWPRVLTESLAIHQRRFVEFTEQDETNNAALSYIEQLQRLNKSLEKNPQTWSLENWNTNERIDFTLNPDRLLSLQFDVLYDEALVGMYYTALKSLPERSDEMTIVMELFITNALDPAFSSMVYIATECNDNGLGEQADYFDAAKDFPLELVDWQKMYDTDLCHLPLFQNRNHVQDLDYADKPTLIFSGGLDPVTPRLWAQELQADLINAKLIEIDYAGHSVLSSEYCSWSDIAVFWQSRDPDTRVDCSEDAGVSE